MLMLNIIGTPIGNLEDISLRAVRTLLSSDIILSEDTRSTGILLERIKEMFHPLLGAYARTAHIRVISYYKEKEFQKLPQILDLLKEGKTISLISEAGMPLISDPGYLLMKSVIREDLPYTVIPGPTALTTALIHSGFKADTCMFIGFFPKKTGELKKLLTKVRLVKELLPDLVLVAYESPHRIHDTVKTIRELIPEGDIVIARELTKKFEEILRNTGTLPQEIKGEITLVLK